VKITEKDLKLTRFQLFTLKRTANQTLNILVFFLEDLHISYSKFKKKQNGGNLKLETRKILVIILLHFQKEVACQNLFINTQIMIILVLLSLAKKLFPFPFDQKNDT
jgi:hypothetical protein